MSAALARPIVEWNGIRVGLIDIIETHFLTPIDDALSARPRRVEGR